VETALEGHRRQTAFIRRRHRRAGITSAASPAKAALYPWRQSGTHVTRSSLDHPSIMRVSPTAEESNAFYRRALSARAAKVSRCIRSEAPSRAIDSDHPRVEGDVGQGGRLRSNSVEDMKKSCSRQFPWNKVSVSHDNERRGDPDFGQLYRRGRRTGHDKSVLSGTIQNDNSEESWSATTYSIYAPETLRWRIIGDIIEYTSTICRNSIGFRFGLPHARRRARPCAGTGLYHLPNGPRICAHRHRRRDGCRPFRARV